MKIALIAKAHLNESEAYGLLKAITVYKTLTDNQLMRLYPDKEKAIKTLLQRLVKQGRVYYNSGGNRYSASELYDKKIDWGMVNSFWVLLDFIDRAKYHTASDYPVKISFITADALYEIIHVPLGNETIISYACTGEDKHTPRRIVVVESTEQIPQIDIPNTSGYCTVSRDGNVEYYKRE